MRSLFVSTLLSNVILCGSSLPEWLSPYMDAERTGSDPGSYAVRAAVSDVVEHYESQMRTAGIAFVKSSIDAAGGMSIRETTGRQSCVVRISAQDSFSKVNIVCVTPAENHPIKPLPAQRMLRRVEDWPQAQWEMTRQEVLEAFNGAAKAPKGLHELNSQEGPIEIEEVDIGGVPLRALFYFDRDSRLNRIQLSLPNAIDPTGDDFERIELALSRKHGDPVRAASGGVRFKSVWMLPNTVIVLDYISHQFIIFEFKMRNEQTEASVINGLSKNPGRHMLEWSPGIDHSTTFESHFGGRQAESTGPNAKAICEQFITPRLKAPATARFSHMGDTEITRVQREPYRVSGWVDSQNSFSALLRSRYTCWVEYAGGNRWNLLSLDLR